MKEAIEMVNDAANRIYTPEQFANEMRATRAPDDRGSDCVPGQIYMANSSRFTEAHFQQGLTDYAVGWGNANPELEANLEFVSPAVTVPMKFEYAKGVNAEYYLSETDDVRAIGSDFGVVRYTSLKVQDKVFNKGLTVIVDMDEIIGQTDWEQRTVSKLMKRLNLNDFRRSVALLKAAATNVAVTWDTSAGKDPDADMLAQVIIGNTAVGTPSVNRALLGITAWQKRMLAHRAQATAGGFASALSTKQQVADLIGVDALAVSRDVYISTGTTKAGVVDTTIGTTGIALFYIAQAGQSTDDPSSIKRFVAPTINGTLWRVYRQELNAKLIAITVEHYSKAVITSTSGIRQLTVS